MHAHVANETEEIHLLVDSELVSLLEKCKQMVTTIRHPIFPF